MSARSVTDIVGTIVTQDKGACVRLLACGFLCVGSGRCSVQGALPVVSLAAKVKNRPRLESHYC